MSDLKIDSSVLPWEDLVTQHVTYAELKNLRNNSQLMPGKQYRIIDYEATTTQEGTRAINYCLFDIIVTADTEYSLNENAKACLPLLGSNDFSSEINFNKWELKYDIDNGELLTDEGAGTVAQQGTVYTWGDINNGKGLIYYLKDDHNNSCGFDFKNIAVNSSYVLGESDAATVIKDLNNNYNASIILNEDIDSYIFPFPEIDIAFDASTYPSIINNATITNYRPSHQDSGAATHYEYIPYVIVSPKFNILYSGNNAININIENSDKILITSSYLDNFDDIINSAAENKINFNIKNSENIILCDVYSKNVNINNSGYSGGIAISGCSAGSGLNKYYGFGGFFGKQLLLNNVGRCIIQQNIELITNPQLILEQIIKINNCLECNFYDITPYNNFICDNVKNIVYNNNYMENHNNIIIKNSKQNTLSIQTSNFLQAYDNSEKEVIFTYDTQQGKVRKYCIEDQILNN